ncbi:response regulator [Acidaminobacter sp. JC074]|uniref:ATP-binding protein n=1 Tax=Acidaminobacter sp. JC074 TaxID=2530199 RepID=UPI001F10950D|nr:ATP-binding protein [Acidaminobacter sp. JC074]MCH4886846.1 response regulator [Acidaminobacter sp. JC074]
MNRLLVYNYWSENLDDILKSMDVNYCFSDDLNIEKNDVILITEKEMLSVGQEILSKGCPVLVMCKTLTRRKVKQYIDLGVSDYILMPVIEEELKKKLAVIQPSLGGKYYENDQEIINRNKRLTRQQWILQSLTQNKALTTESMFENTSPSLGIISKAVVDGLDVSGCSIALFEEMNVVLRCQERYFPGVDFSGSCELHKKDFVEYFEAILSGTQITISSMETTLYKKIAEFLQVLTFQSSLHLPIWFRGEVVGVAIADSVKKDRMWKPDEISFLRAITDLITINMETKERLKAQKEAEEASRAKSDFLANMSHEIRTPMNAVIGLSHLALQTQLSDKQKDYLTKINDSGKHLLSLLNDILDVSKVEAGKMTLEHLVFNMKDVMNHIYGMMNDKAQNKNLSFEIDIKKGVPLALKGDPHRLSQILINLISNAIKFTERGSVKVLVDRVYSDMNNDELIMLQFDVIDTGVGIASSLVDKLFDSFEQGDSSITRRYGGTGLGLSICKQLVSLFGGQISAESTLNQGSCFSFTVNLEVAKEEAVKDIFVSKDVTASHYVVLVVEDNEINQQIIEENLTSQGIITVGVSNGQEAVDYLESGEPCGMILMDLQMPVMDGHTCARTLRKQSKYDHIPILAISADARKEMKMMTINDGMNDFILKPIEQASLLRSVYKWMDKKMPDLYIEDIDVGLGLTYCNNNMDLYKSLLKKFSDNHGDDLLKVKEAIRDRTGEEANLLHALKGVLGSLGASLLKEDLETLEDFVNYRKRGYKAKLEETDQKLKLLVSRIKAISFDQEIFDKEKDFDKVKELLTSLQVPLRNGSINEVSDLLNQLESFHVENDLLNSYKEMTSQIRRYQYDYAELSLENMLKRLEK